MSVHIHEKYQFHITAPDGSTWQAYPRNASLEWKWEKDSDWGFFRKTLATDLVFVTDPSRSIDDFDRLLAIEESSDRCNFILIDVLLVCGPVNFPWWSGRIRCTAGKWDKSFCRVKIKAEPNDDYTCLFDHWEEELDFASALEPRTLVIASEFTMQTAVCGWLHGGDVPAQITMEHVFTNCPVYNDAGADAWRIYHTIVLIQHIIVYIARETAVGTCSGTEPVAPSEEPGWVLLEDNCPTDSTWVRPPSVLPIFEGGDNPNGGILLEREIHNAYPLSDVLTWLLDQTGCGLSIISDFLNINPDNTAPDNLAYQKAAIYNSETHIIHFSDLIKDDEDGPDIKAVVPFSLKTILKNLPGNIEIAIDNNSLRIEHRSYFRRIKMLDLTNPDHIDLINGLARYEYNKLKLPKTEEFLWKNLTDGKNKDFDGMPIEYNSACVDSDSKKATIPFEIFYSNLDYIINNKEDYETDLDGLVIVSTRDGRVLSELCPISGAMKINGHFAISTLHQNYYKWDRPLPTGIMNGQPTEFFRWLRQKQQSDIKVRMCCDDYSTFDPDDLVKTQLGWGEVDEPSLKEPTGILELQLLHH